MAKRIRYSKTNQPNVKQSVQMFFHPTTGARYKIVLNNTEGQWLVINDLTDIIEASGRTNTENKMKKQAKEALEILGVSFAEETRSERKVKTVNAA